MALTLLLAAGAEAPRALAVEEDADTDGDGVLDDSDRCRLVAGAIDTDGCPQQLPNPWTGSLRWSLEHRARLGPGASFTHTSEMAAAELELLSPGGIYTAVVRGVATKMESYTEAPCSRAWEAAHDGYPSDYFSTGAHGFGGAVDLRDSQLEDGTPITFFRPYPVEMTFAPVSNSCPPSYGSPGPFVTTIGGFEWGVGSYATEPLLDDDPDPDRLVGTTTWTLEDPPRPFYFDNTAYSFTVTYDLSRESGGRRERCNAYPSYFEYRLSGEPQPGVFTDSARFEIHAPWCYDGESVRAQAEATVDLQLVESPLADAYVAMLSPIQWYVRRPTVKSLQQPDGGLLTSAIGRIDVCLSPSFGVVKAGKTLLRHAPWNKYVWDRAAAAQRKVVRATIRKLPISERDRSALEDLANFLLEKGADVAGEGFCTTYWEPELDIFHHPDGSWSLRYDENVYDVYSGRRVLPAEDAGSGPLTARSVAAAGPAAAADEAEEGPVPFRHAWHADLTAPTSTTRASRMEPQRIAGGCVDDPADGAFAVGELFPRRVRFDRADIVQRCIEQSDDGITLVLRVAEPTDPVSDPSWGESSATSAGWAVDTTGDGVEDHLVVLHGAGGTTRVSVSDGRGTGMPICEGQGGLMEGRYEARVPTDCLPEGSSLIGAGFAYDTDPTDLEAPIFFDDTVVARRLAGASRVETAAEIAAAQFPGPAPVVYLARADVFADAVAAGSLTRGPILLVPSCGAVPAVVEARITANSPSEVVALGGEAAVCPDLLNAAASLVGAQPSRLAGASRIQTAVEISRHQFADPASLAVVHLARADFFADAVAGGSLYGGPTLLVPQCGEVPDAVRQEIARLDPDRVIALGGQAAVCTSVLTDAAGARPTERYAGGSRIDTAAVIAGAAAPGPVADVYLARADGSASGDVSADAVAAGVLSGGPVLLVPACGPLPPSVTVELERLDPGHVIALGGQASICDALLDSAVRTVTG